MYKIFKITSNPVVDFAAEELKKYLRMMMPRCGEIEISYAPSAADGFRLGVMADFGLDTSEAKELYRKFLLDFGKYEFEIERYFDICIFGKAMDWRLLRKDEAPVNLGV